MFEFIIGPSGAGKTDRCLQNIRDRLETMPEGTPLFLVLPEHMTFEIERKLAVLMNDKGGFSRVFVFGFRRLCQYILTQEGGVTKSRITETGKNLILAKIILAHRSELTFFARAAQQRNFVSFLCTVIEELKTYKITPTALQSAIPAIPDKILQQKLADIVLLYGEYISLSSNCYTDAEDILDLTASKIRSAKWLENSEIWIDGFTFFNPQEQSVLLSLFKKASSVHLTLCINDLGDTANNEETALFHRQYITFKEIKEICDQLNLETKITKLEQFHRFLKPAQRMIAANMFIFPVKKSESSEGLIIAEAANRRLEAEAVAIDILRLCREENYVFSDIGIVIREKTYDDLLHAVFHDYQIPFFSDRKRLFIHHPLAELLRSCLEAVRTWQYEPLLRCFKTDFFPATRDDVDMLENYILEFGIRGKKNWLSSTDWQYSRSPLAEQQLSQEEKVFFDKINAVRRQLIAPLQQLAENLHSSETVRSVTEVIYKFLIELHVPEKLSLWQKRAEDSGALLIAKEQQQIWHDVIDFMDQLIETCGEEVFTLSAYAEILSDGLEALQIALIPPGIDYVTIASFEQNSLENKKAIYILGANEGSMPQHVKNEGLLNDLDRLCLHGAGVNLSAGAGEDNFFEKFLLYKAFTLSREYLWISYPLSDTDGGSLSRSPLIERLYFMFSLKKNQHISILLENYSDKNEKRRVVTGRRSISYLTTALRQYKEKGRIADFWFDVYNWLLTKTSFQKDLFVALSGLFVQASDTFLSRQSASMLYTKNGFLKGSVTRFEQFHNCPFKHFAHYALSLTERTEFNFSAPDRGVLLHETMRTFGETLLTLKKRWNDVSKEERHELCQNIVSELAVRLQNKILLSSGQYKHLTKRIAKAAEMAIDRLCDFSEHSEFSPIAVEKAFGREKIDLPPLIYDLEDGYKINISGQIDRIDVDRSGQYFLIIDYKSGNAYINIAEVYHGLKLQLLTYMLAVQNSSATLGPVLPAGILYCFLKSTLLTFDKEMPEGKIKTEIARQMRMSGWVLLDENIIKKIDDSSLFIKVKFNKDGSISKASRTSIKTEEEFGALLRHMSEMLVDTGNHILAGEISPTPYKMNKKTACMFCPYISFCRFDAAVPGYRYNDLPGETDELIMKKIINNQQFDNRQ
ncbi:helicase-exonuclease AddAB subunit AddB [Pectinatus haikarae]|uniref:helicase-exonuclease AddAB subunit AddB n=1 Tax=Pectinatus haikarae TaxID=349096 RepID=UPI0018C8595F|nr:helicase-exonuclease AddAB subunit AddB [Pectinatus haikarae]